MIPMLTPSRRSSVACVWRSRARGRASRSRSSRAVAPTELAHSDGRDRPSGCRRSWRRDRARAAGGAQASTRAARRRRGRAPTERERSPLPCKTRIEQASSSTSASRSARASPLRRPAELEDSDQSTVADRGRGTPRARMKERINFRGTERLGREASAPGGDGFQWERVDRVPRRSKPSARSASSCASRRTIVGRRRRSEGGRWAR